jgi:hypothetical protein
MERLEREAHEDKFLKALLAQIDANEGGLGTRIHPPKID